MKKKKDLLILLILNTEILQYEMYKVIKYVKIIVEYVNNVKS